MSSFLIKNARTIVTMDENRSEIEHGWICVKEGVIDQVSTNEVPMPVVDEIFDLTDHIILPGFVNTHHHFYQTLTRVVPAAQDANLFNWLKTLYPIWAKIQPEDVFISTQTALAELALSGCTTASDHLYLFPNGSKLDDEIEAALEIGVRLHASRGSMSLGESDGGLPPDSVVETDAAILRDSQRVIEKYHDPNPGSMTQIVLAPCSPFSVTPELMRQSARLAREYGVQLHTHLAETEDEEDFCQQQFGYRPVGYMQSLDWVGDDVWFAHSVYINDEEIDVFAKTGCGVAHCPASNMRLASGIAPILKLRNAGVDVGVGVDGAASNDGSNLMEEVRLAMLLSRVGAGIAGASRSGGGDQPIMTARQALELATVGGAAVLGRSDIGALKPGMRADFIAINLNRLDYAGALHDPVAAIAFCAPVRVDYSWVNGKPIVSEGQMTTTEVPVLIEKHNRTAKRLLE